MAKEEEASKVGSMYLAELRGGSSSLANSPVMRGQYSKRPQILDILASYLATRD